MEDKRRPISVEEHKKIMLEILLYFDKFCKEHNLRYYLADGSLIGCIRHQGFIPWDDDIDLEMPRPDWLKLKELFVDQGPYVLCTPFDKDSRFHFSKIYDSRTITTTLELISISLRLTVLRMMNRNSLTSGRR